MNAGLPLHRAPAAGFDRPWDLLAACHERVERMLVLLERLGAYLPEHGPDRQARDAARDVIRYFDIAAPLHHEDEERHVFPRLREQGQRALADRLQAEHAALAAAWAAVRPTLTAIAEARRPASLPPDLWPGFAALYRRHLHDEDAGAYPLAAAATPGDRLPAIGAEMAGRRGL